MQQPVTLLAEASDDLGLANVPQQLDELIALAEQCNPKLAGLAWEIQRDRQKHKLACLQQYPDLQVGLQWGLVSDDYKVLSPVANGHDQVSFNVGTTLPIWRDKINAGVREAANRTSSTTKRLDAERDALYGKLRRLLAQADAFTEQRDIYEKRIIPRTEDTLKLSIADYRGKRTDFFSLDRNLSRTADVRDATGENQCVTCRNGCPDRKSRRLPNPVAESRRKWHGERTRHGLDF